eukprot:6146325-Amphidinium_carterae.1
MQTQRKTIERAKPCKDGAKQQAPSAKALYIGVEHYGRNPFELWHGNHFRMVRGFALLEWWSELRIT